MGDPGRPLQPVQSEIDYGRIAQVLREILAESRKPEPLRVDLKEICRRFCISRSTLYRYMEQGAVPFEKITGKLLFEPSAVDQALKRLRRNPIRD